nr:hypothetical protein [Sedimentibacter sp.]
MSRKQAEKDTDTANVIAKKKSALDWVNKINNLNAEDRMNCELHYSLVSDELFYQFKENGVSVLDILKFTQIKKVETVEG